MKKLGKATSVRLPIGLDRQLRELAKTEKMELSTYVRKILIEHMSDTGTKNNHSDLQQELNNLTEKLALGFEALLITAGKQSTEKSKDWVNRKIRGL